MQQLNTIPIEDFLDKARIARKSSQKSVTLTSKEYNDLYDSLSMVMTKLASALDQHISKIPDKIEIKMEGGRF